jgi:cobalt-zinc-cadmium resistance protein CzcA
MKKTASYIILIYLLIFLFSAQAQLIELSIDKAVEIALQKNVQLSSLNKQISYYQFEKNTATDLPPANFNFSYGQYNSIFQDNSFSVSQNIPFITLFKAQHQLSAAQVTGVQLKINDYKNYLSWQVKKNYLELLYLKEYQQFLRSQDSLYQAFVHIATIRFKTGEGRQIEKIAAETQLAEIQNLLNQSQLQYEMLISKLRSYLFITDSINISEKKQLILSLLLDENNLIVSQNPLLAYLKHQILIEKYKKNKQIKTLYPNLSFGYTTQTLKGVPIDRENTQFATGSMRFQFFSFGINFNLWMKPQLYKIKMAAIQQELAEIALKEQEFLLTLEAEQAAKQYLIKRNQLDYYLKTGLPNAQLIANQTKTAYQKGSISYYEYLINLQQYKEIMVSFLKSVHEFNQSVIYIQYLTANQ